ncbi:MAG TPA: ATP-binding protein [Polyangia bacterium]|nr:ATP-binding protein [Polyangia bacterium]
MTREAINFSWLVKLRWGAIAGQIATIVGVTHVLEVPLPLTALYAIIAVELVSNIVCVAAARRADAAEWWSGVVMVLDVVLLTALLHFAGGPFNPFSFLYLVEIALAAVIVRARWTWALVIVSLIGSGALFVGEPHMLVSPHGDHMELHLRGMWVAFGVAASFIVYFLLRVRRDLEAREAELAEAQRRVDRQERLASLATLAAGAAHELATPLGTIALAARELERHLEKVQADAASLEDVHLIRAQVDRCRAILDGMAADAGETAGEQPRDVAIAELLRAAVDGLRAEPRIDVEVGGVDGQRVRVPPRAVAQALKSLLKNAQEASAPERAVSLRANVRERSVAIEVVDRGAGMPEAVLARAGEPFFTTKEPGRGMGLGLFLTRTLVERLGGELTLSSEAGAGTRALVLLPIA